MVELPSALLNADILGQFLTKGGQAAFYCGAEPNTPINELNKCAGFGNMMLFEADETGKAKWPMPSFFGAQLVTQQWAGPANETHRLFPATTNIRDTLGRELVRAYAVWRPDQRWAIMLINKDPKTAHRVTVGFSGGNNTTPQPMRGATEVYQYGSAQYQWRPDGENGHPLRDDPPRLISGSDGGAIDLPAYSLTIVRGQGPMP